MKKVLNITTSRQMNGLFLATATVQLTNGEIKDFNVPEMDADLIHVAGKTEDEARTNLKKELDLKGIDYKYFKL